MIQYHTLPEVYRDEVKAYIEDGEPVSSPLIHSILVGDLWAAYELSGPIPEIPGDQLKIICGWIYGQAPSECYRSHLLVRAWMLAGGANGIERSKRKNHARILEAFK